MTTTKKRGRSAQYANAAARARAWRQRQKATLEAAVAAVDVMKSERMVSPERRVEKPVVGPSTCDPADPQRVIRLAREKLTGFKSDEAAKRFRTNAARVAATAKDLLALLDHPTQGTRLHEDDQAFLLQVAAFFSALHSGFEVVQWQAKRAQNKAREDRDAQHQRRLAELVEKTWGHTPVLDEAVALVRALLQFDQDGPAWIVARHGVDKGHTALWNGPALRAVIRSNDIQKVSRAVAEARHEMGERGHRWQDENGSHYTAGWSDFEEYRSNVNW